MTAASLSGIQYMLCKKVWQGGYTNLISIFCNEMSSETTMNQLILRYVKVKWRVKEITEG